jgi:transposase-like protein
MERAIQPEISTSSCGADECMREHHEAITRLSRELVVSRGLLYTWRYRLEPPDAEVEGTVSTQNSRESRLRREVNKLKRLLADKTVEVDFFRRA